MTYRASKTGHYIDGVPMYRVRDGRNGPSYGPIDGRKSWPRAKAEAIAEIANETRSSPQAAARSLTLAQAAERFIAIKQADGKYDQEHYRLPWIRRHAIGRTQLRSLTTPQGARWRDWLQRQEQKPETVRKCLSLASAVVQHAIEHGFGPKHNPFREVSRPPRGQRPPPRVMPVEHEQQLQQLPAAARCIVLALLWSGLRRGELMGLELPDVQPCAEGYWLDVHRGTAGGHATKTNRRRQVLLWGLGAAALSEWLELHRPGLKQRSRGNQRVFPICLGRYIAASVWAVADLPHYTPNELRHTHSTGLTTGRWGYRWGRPEAAARMGHSTKTQDDHYLNATGGPAARASRAAAAAWREITDGPVPGKPAHCAAAPLKGPDLILRPGIAGESPAPSMSASDRALTHGEEPGERPTAAFTFHREAAETAPQMAALETGASHHHQQGADHYALTQQRANGRTPIDGQPAAAEPSTRSRGGNAAYIETAPAPLEPRRAGGCAVSHAGASDEDSSGTVHERVGARGDGCAARTASGQCDAGGGDGRRAGAQGGVARIEHDPRAAQALAGVGVGAEPDAGGESSAGRRRVRRHPERDSPTQTSRRRWRF